MSTVDDIEALYARGVTDGLPVVPPTRACVDAAVEASGRPAEHVVARIAPGLGHATVEKIAVNAVMAGCRPEYMPVVIAAVQAIAEPALGLVGVSGTTDAVGLLLIVNGPIRKSLSVNCGVGLFGPGWRANATIGRAVHLVWMNIGGARLGVISMPTFAQPGRYTYCIGEYEEENPWPPLSVDHGFASDASTVAALAAEATKVISDAPSETARDILTTVARSGQVIASYRHARLSDTVLVIGPEHARTIGRDGWSKADIQQFLWESTKAEVDGQLVPKFQDPQNVKIVVAGSVAGRFSAWIPGWPFPDAPARLVLKTITCSDLKEDPHHVHE